MAKALRQESFGNTRSEVTRQMLKSSQDRFLSAQVKRLVDGFEFENSRLEFAKFAFDYTFDPGKYFVVSEAFDFDSSKRASARYVESRLKHPGAK